MNDRIYELIIKVLDSDLSRQTKEEIVRFNMLPRNTPVKPPIEISDTGDVGTVPRPTFHDEARKLDPQMAASEDAVRETLKGQIK